MVVVGSGGDHHVSGHDEHVGKAQIMHSEAKAPPLFRYGCRFTEKTGPWVLQ